MEDLNLIRGHVAYGNSQGLIRFYNNYERTFNLTNNNLKDTLENPNLEGDNSLTNIIRKYQEHNLLNSLNKSKLEESDLETICEKLNTKISKQEIEKQSKRLITYLEPFNLTIQIIAVNLKNLEQIPIEMKYSANNIKFGNFYKGFEIKYVLNYQKEKTNII